MNDREIWIDRSQRQIIIALAIVMGIMFGLCVVRAVKDRSLVEGVVIAIPFLVLVIKSESVWPLKVSGDTIHLAPLGLLSVGRRSLKFHQLRELQVDRQRPDEETEYRGIYAVVRAVDLQGRRYRSFVWKDSAQDLIRVLSGRVNPNILCIDASFSRGVA